MLMHCRDRELEGAVEAPPSPPLDLRSIATEDFQKAAAAAFEHALGFRGHSVTIDNTLLYHLFGETRPGNGVVVGKNGVLFSREDLGYFNEASSGLPPPELVDRFAAELARLQSTLARQGIAVVPLILPGKVTPLWKDAVPERWTRDRDEPRSDALGYQRLREALVAHGVQLVDAHALLSDVREVPREALWGPDARHWSRYSACLALSRITSVAESLGRRSPTIHCEHRWQSPRRSDVDLDLLRLLNARWVRRGSRDVAMPIISVAGAASSSRLMVVSSSFGFVLGKVAEDSHAFGRVIVDYYGSRFVETEHEDVPVTPRSDSWRAEMLGNDIYVLELFEPYFWPGDDYFVLRAIRDLAAAQSLADTPK